MIELKDVIVSTLRGEQAAHHLKIPTDLIRAIELSDHFLRDNEMLCQVGIEIDVERNLTGFRLVPSEATLIIKKSGDLSLQIYLTDDEFIEYGLWRQDLCE